MNQMRKIRIAKVTLNIGVGKDMNKLEKGILLLKAITGIAPVKTITSKRIPSWGLRPGLPIGCKITLRKEKAVEVLKRLLEAKDNMLSESQFDANGNLAFGIHEYIDIPGVEYDPDIGMMGLEVCVTFERPGYRIKMRKLRKTKVKNNHRISKEEVIDVMKKEFNIKFGEEE
ncbi:MAG: 50S ribosomal protein L5 [Nanoarchaeota archaeon]|nr:50S ribosomal protein L5 [Nanoarchaeota archaeon]MCK5629282.1 50S ribosomal protein L5 [Nanoarchaeota archaeon]